MTKIIFATGNKDKMREIREIMADCDVEIYSMKEAGINIDIVEDGDTFEANSTIKAKAISDYISGKGMSEEQKDDSWKAVSEKYKGAIVLADDSGLEIDYLNKEPGVYSARYMGEDTPYTVKNNHIIELLKDVEGDDRSARFVCVIACVFPDGRSFTCRGVVEGQIGYSEKGENGFGYDPIFYVPEFGCTTAELSEEQKNAVSHRGKALEKMREILKESVSAE